jgi:hypothetical protein
MPMAQFNNSEIHALRDLSATYPEPAARVVAGLCDEVLRLRSTGEPPTKVAALLDDYRDAVLNAYPQEGVADEAQAERNNQQINARIALDRAIAALHARAAVR